MHVVKLISMNGEELCSSVSVEPDTPLSELATLAATALGAKQCRLVSPNGMDLDIAMPLGTSGLVDGDAVVAVALFDHLEKYHPFVLPAEIVASLRANLGRGGAGVG